MRRLATLAVIIAGAAGTAAAELTIDSVALNVATIGQPYVPVSLVTSGDPGPIVWSFVPAGSAPFGFVLGPGPVGGPGTDGTFCYGLDNPGGPPNCAGGNVITPPGVYTVTIRATSLSTGQSATQKFTLPVVNPLQIPSTPPPDATANQTYSYQIPVSGGTGQFTWSITSGTLPAGIALNPGTGFLSGIAPGVNATYGFIVQVLDQVTGFTASQTFTFNVVGGLAILTTTLPDAIVNQPYTPIQLQAVGSPTLIWSVQKGWVLPPGIILSPGGVLSGTGLNVGQYMFVIQAASPATGLVATRTFSFFITLGPLSISERTLPVATQNIPYQVNLTPLGGIPPYTWSFDVPNQQGFSIGFNTGVISGTPTKAGVVALPVTLKDSAGRAFSISYALNVGTAVSITTTFLANSPPGLPYSDTLTATGGVLTYQWSVVAGGLPPGLTLTTKNGIGLVSGTPTTPGVFQFTVQVLDFAGGTDRKVFSITIGPVLAITTTSLPDGALGGVQYSQTLAATNGTPLYTWSIATGSLPPGLQLDGATGIISGTPTAAGTFTFDVQVNDTARGVAHRNLTINIPLLITNGDLSGVALAAFSQTLTAAGGKPPYTWSSGALPAGLQLNSATGVISGTPGAGGTSQVAFTVTDVKGLTGTKIVNITILQPPAPATSIGVDSSSTQPAVSLTTSAPYASDITGVLKLKFAPAPGITGTDNIIGFSDGSTSLQFTVPATQTRATFTASNGAPKIITGTVAGTITLTASLTAGGQDITPSPAPTKTITIDPAVPVILSVALQQVTGGLNVVVTGYSNTREVSSGSFTFAVSSGNTLSQSQLTVPLTSAYATWFASATSNATGGQFKLTVPFSVTQGAASAITKVGVTLTNSKGASASVSSP